MARTRPDVTPDGVVIPINTASLLASARRIEVGNPDDLQWLKKQRQEWQTRAWAYNDTVGEVNFAHRYVNNMLSRLKLYPAWRPTPQADPIPMEAGNPPDNAPDDWDLLCEAAELELERLAGASGSYGSILGPAAWNISLVGECYLVALPDDDEPSGERFEILSIDELKVVDAERGDLRIRDHEQDSEGTPIGSNQFFMRMWRRHPRWRNRADAPMSSLLDICEELVLLSQAIRASAESRLNAGILKLPSELFLPGPADLVDPGDGQVRQDPFMADLEQTLITPILDPGAPSARVPLLLRGAADALQAVEHMLLLRPVDEQQLAERDELRSRLATGLDLPKEILMGMSEANHWTAWAVDEQTYKAHLEPLAFLICDALTRGFLQPSLAAQDYLPNGIIVGHDPSDLIGDENEFEQALSMHREAVVTDAYLRRIGGAADDDAPDDAELLRRQEYRMPPKPATSKTAEPPLPGETPPSGEDTPHGPPAEDGTRAASAFDSNTVTLDATILDFASHRKLQTLARRLTDIDRTLRARLLNRADGLVLRALEMAGAKIKRRAGQYRNVAARLKDHPTRDFAAILGRDLLTSWQMADDLTDPDDQFPEFAALYAAWTLAAWKAARAAMAKTLDPDRLDEITTVTAATETDLTAGWRNLQDSLHQTIHDRLFDPHPASPTRGEFDAFGLITTDPIRESLAIAGGAATAQPDTITGHPSGGIATGDSALEDLQTYFQVDSEGGMWLYGDPSARTRPFEPHEALDGIHFTDWNDDQLTNPDSFPDSDYYYPGDHDGCQCDYIPTLQAGT